MAYLHRVDTLCETGPAVRHFRDTVKQSGLSVVSEIGRTMIGDVVKIPTNGVVIPNPLEVRRFGSNNEPVDIQEGSIPADDISDFVPTGLEAWAKLCGKLGVARGRARLAEAMITKTEHGKVRDSGLIEITKPSEPEFAGFDATVDELEVMARLEASINNSTHEEPDVPAGFYA